MDIEYGLVVSSLNNKQAIATKDYDDIFEFVTQNQDAKFWKPNYLGKTKILNKKTFLEDFYETTENQGQFFVMADILLNDSAKSTTISKLRLNTEYLEWKRQNK